MRKALTISGVISAIVFAVEGICAYTLGTLPISLPIPGGECVVYEGIGWSILKTYPITSSPELDQTLSKTIISFAPVTLIAFFVLLLLVILLIEAVFRRKTEHSA